MTASFIDLAFEQAQRAQRAGEVPVGCVIIQNGQMIASNYNRMVQDRDPTAHAEMLAIRQACRTLNTPYLVDADLYVTLEPCAMCAGAIAFARLRRLYYASYDPKGGAIDHGIKFFQSAQCFHKMDIYGGIDDQRGQNVLRQFFLALR